MRYLGGTTRSYRHCQTSIASNYEFDRSLKTAEDGIRRQGAERRLELAEHARMGYRLYSRREWLPDSRAVVALIRHFPTMEAVPLHGVGRPRISIAAANRLR